MPTMPVARVLTRLFGIAGAVTDATEQRSGAYESETYVELLFCSRRPVRADAAISCRTQASHVAHRATATGEAAAAWAAFGTRKR